MEMIALFLFVILFYFTSLHKQNKKFLQEKFSKPECFFISEECPDVVINYLQTYSDAPENANNGF